MSTVPGGDRPASVLLARDLVKRYKKRTVVNGVSIDVRAGEIVGPARPNGAGKTTSFYMVVGLVPVDGGSHRARRPRHHQAADARARPRPASATCLRKPRCSAKLSVADNVMAILELRDDLDSAGRKRELERLLEELHITLFAKVWACRCPAASGGVRKSPARWRPIRASSCSTSRSPVSIRSR